MRLFRCKEKQEKRVETRRKREKTAVPELFKGKGGAHTHGHHNTLMEMILFLFRCLLVRLFSFPPLLALRGRELQ